MGARNRALRRRSLTPPPRSRPRRWAAGCRSQAATGRIVNTAVLIALLLLVVFAALVNR